MNKMPHVLLILTALGLGIITGHHEWKLDKQKEEQAGQDDFYERWAKYLEEGDGVVDDTNNWYGTSEHTEIIKLPNRIPGIGTKFYPIETEPKEAQQPVQEAKKEQKKQGFEYESDVQKKPAVKQEAPSYKKELDRIDFLMMEASTYIRIATIDVNLRSEFAKSAFDCTSEALDIFGKIPEKAQDSPEILRRLDTITKTRHAAMKLAPIEK